jgi:hypothetical protein
MNAADVYVHVFQRCCFGVLIKAKHRVLAEKVVFMIGEAIYDHMSLAS